MFQNRAAVANCQAESDPAGHHDGRQYFVADRWRSRSMRDPRPSSGTAWPPCFSSDENLHSNRGGRHVANFRVCRCDVLCLVVGLLLPLIR